MRLFSILTFTFLLIMMLLGCQQEKGINYESAINTAETTSEEPLENDVIVDSQGKISNLHKYDSFVQNYKTGTKDSIRITSYTIEGSPIFYNLKYDGERINYTFDNSQDGFGGTEKGVISTSCTSLDLIKIENRVGYVLNGCSSEVGKTFYFSPSE